MLMNKKVNTALPDQERLRRAVMISLFTWRRAEPDDDTDTPFGWWGDTWPTVQNDRIGSRLHLLKRSTLTNQTVQKAKEYIAQALTWMTDDGIALRVDIEVIRSGIDKLTATVTLTLPDHYTKTMTINNLWSVIHAK
ncbi:phage GP46 family protein [Arsenophonus sp. PmNCSU2021_1]|uniref:phage GP46 family protein n=1 Tax=Arsenophonus sp. PmNCSU2021_1 TaxID=3118989 RepID=UPI002FF1F31D